MKTKYVFCEVGTEYIYMYKIYNEYDVCIVY
jgi:hypothetical protein